MSERFSDEVWLRARAAYLSEKVEAKAIAAMRAVLEGHEHAQIARLEATVAMQADVIKDLAGPVEELENRATDLATAHQSITARLAALESLVRELQAYRLEAGWQDVDEPIQRLLDWECQSNSAASDGSPR